MTPIQVTRSDEYQIPRARLVEELRNVRKISDERVLEAMMRIPRHLFVPEALVAQAYRDHALPIAAKQTISQPGIVARMTELLTLGGNSKVLEIGTGSGYQTALLASIASYVYSIERIPELARSAADLLHALGFKNVKMKCEDGTVGWAENAPFDAILVAAGGPEIPTPLVSQLAVGGVLVIPVGDDQATQRLVRVRRTESAFDTEDCGPCSFVPLIGEHGWK
jgi:protein-L-isoaspartate(D-aspartate) O-methyltransferase